MARPKNSELTSTEVVNGKVHRYQKQIDAWKRDEYGLLQNIEYHFKDNGLIDWRRMIPSKYLVINKDKFKNVDISTLNIEDLDDSKLLIKLNGISQLLKIRGYLSVDKTLTVCHENFVAATCSISLLPNFESDMQYIQYTGEADAHLGSTNGFGKNFLSAIAGNRSFVRAVKNALGIEILGEDELSEAKPQEEPEVKSTGSKPIDSLIKFLNTHNINFDKFKAGRSEVDEKAKDWKSFEDIETGEIFGLIHWAKERVKNKTANKK